MDTQTLNTGEKLFIEDHFIQSIKPPETLFGYTYWSYMIPPEKPRNMLILGYGEGTIDKLTRKVWGNDINVYGVDKRKSDVEPLIKMSDEEDYPLVEVCDDARNFLKICNIVFDYIVIDLYNGDDICDFVFESSFVNKISDICSKRVSINLFNKYIGCEKVYEDFFRKEFTKDILNNKIIFFRKQEGLYG